MCISQGRGCGKREAVPPGGEDAPRVARGRVSSRFAERRTQPKRAAQPPVRQDGRPHPPCVLSTTSAHPWLPLQAAVSKGGSEPCHSPPRDAARAAAAAHRSRQPGRPHRGRRRPRASRRSHWQRLEVRNGPRACRHKGRRQCAKTPSSWRCRQGLLRTRCRPHAPGAPSGGAPSRTGAGPRVQQQAPRPVYASASAAHGGASAPEACASAYQKAW